MPILRLTYEELAKRIGRSSEAARALVRRHRWPVEHGNDGKARVLVDEREVDARPDGRPPGHHPDASGRVRGDDHALQLLADELQAVRADRDRLAQDLIAARERAAGAEGESRALRERVDDLKAQMDRERTRADRLEARLARPWWRWLG
jgi:hypothetical protein